MVLNLMGTVEILEAILSNDERDRIEIMVEAEPAWFETQEERRDEHGAKVTLAGGMAQAVVKVGDRRYAASLEPLL